MKSLQCVESDFLSINRLCGQQSEGGGKEALNLIGGLLYRQCRLASRHFNSSHRALVAPYRKLRVGYIFRIVIVIIWPVGPLSVSQNKLCLPPSLFLSLSLSILLRVPYHTMQPLKDVLLRNKSDE